MLLSLVFLLMLLLMAAVLSWLHYSGVVIVMIVLYDHIWCICILLYMCFCRLNGHISMQSCLVLSFNKAHCSKKPMYRSMHCGWIGHHTYACCAVMCLYLMCILCVPVATFVIIFNLILSNNLFYWNISIPSMYRQLTDILPITYQHPANNLPYP